MEMNNNTAPDCEYFGRCGGCRYRDIPYEEQLKKKAKEVTGLFAETFGEPKPENPEGLWEFEGITPSPLINGYRNKMEFSFGDERKNGPLALGLHKKKSFYDIVNLRSCLICPEDMNIIRNAVLDHFAPLYEEGRVDYVRQKTHIGYLRHLLIRRAENTGEILICLVTASPSKSEKLKAEEEEGIINGFVSAVLSIEDKLSGSIAGICHIYNDALSDVVKSDRTDILYGRDYIYEEICGLKFKISVFSFFQTNSKGAELLYGTARDYAAKAGYVTDMAKADEKEVSCEIKEEICPAEDVSAAIDSAEIYNHENDKNIPGNLKAERKPVIFDLYCGTGTISQLMSPAASEVYGIEIVEEAVSAAKENAALNSIENVHFIAGDVMKILCGEEGKNLPRPDLIILDPPREGVHPKALGKILEYGCENIIYISCKAKSLACELAAFKSAGYDLVKARCVDMFPATANVETVVRVSIKNKKPDTHINVSLDMDDHHRIIGDEE